MEEDWAAVALAINARMAETRVTQMELAARAGVSLMTVRELQHNLTTRRRQPRTLAAVSEALGLPRDHLEHVLRGQRRPPDRATDDPVLDELREIRDQLRAISARLDKLEQGTPAPGPAPDAEAAPPAPAAR